MSLLDNASLILTPNAGKEGKLYSVIPSNGNGDFTVTRATTATRVNSAGLVEVVPYNLFRYSEQFDNGAWVKTSATITTNATTAPNGTLTADKAIATNTVSATRAVYQGFTPILDSTYNISVYVKAAEYTKFTISDIGNGRFGASFDLVAETSTSLGGFNYVSSLITNEGNGWYKCSIVATGSAVGWAVGFMGYPDGATPSTSGVSYAGNGVSGVFIWGAQLVESSISKAYFPTTDRLNIPRLDYSLGSCPNLLLEPQRTNLALRSEEFDNVAWVKYRSDLGINTQVSPSGVQNADTFTSSVGAVGVPAIASQSFTFVGNTRYSYSIFVKKIGNFDTFRLGYVDNSVGFTGGIVSYNVTTQAITITTQAPNGSVTASMQSFGNGWYRLVLNFLTIATPTYNYIEVSIPTISTTNTFAIWGAQLEAGSYPTSYIPTTSASVTRNADVISKTGISSLIGQTEGTFVFKVNVVQPIGLGVQILLIASNDSQSQLFIVAFVNNAGAVAFDFYIGSSYSFTLESASPISKGINSIGVVYKAGAYKLYINGTQVASSTNSSPITNTISKLSIGSGAAPMYYNFLNVWQTALTDDQLELLTGDSFNTYAEMAAFYNYTLQ
jgi:hypothetical protein